jgi:phage terminase large subunit-like protein
MTDYATPPKNLNGYDPLRTAGDCVWNPAAAQRAVDFFREVLTHPDDSPFTVAGQPFDLVKWQADYVATLYGWKRPDGTRRYRESMACLPRKNGKSTLAAGIVLYELTANGRQAAQIYSAAQTRDQAGLVYSMASKMAANSRLLSAMLSSIASTKRIVYKGNGSFYRAIPADAGPVHGTKPAVVIFDELHTQKNRDLYDALKTGQGATVDPLFISITTAGHDRHSICYDLWTRARQIRDGENDNPYFLPLLFELDEAADWTDESTWAACNPNLGKSISIEFLRDECSRAKESPAYENTFRNLYLNQWTEQAVRWLSMEKWDACNETPEQADARPAYAGLDLSTNVDLTAFVIVLPGDDGTYDVYPYFWIPEESMRARCRRDGVPYDIWAKQGVIKTTPGNAIDHDTIRRDINELREKFNIREIAADRWNANQIITQLGGDGFEIAEFGQGYASMSSPAKALEALVLERKLRHGGHPVLRWNAANVAIEQDAAGNIKPSKAKSTERIDGIVALTMAIGRAQVTTPQEWYYSNNEVEIA